MNLALVFPMFAMVLLSAVVMMIMFLGRVSAIRSGKLKLNYFKTYRDNVDLPDNLIQAQRHFTNLFEAPVLFFAGCLAAMMVPIYGPMILIWAWIFVVARVLHAWIHLTHNKVMWRMRAYMISWIAILAIWFMVAFKVFILYTSTIS